MADRQYTHGDGMEAFGDLIRAHRYRHGWTQDVLSERSGLSRPTIASIEAGHRQSVKARELRALCETLDIPTTHAAAVIGYVDLDELVTVDYPMPGVRPGEPGRTLAETEADLARMRDNPDQSRLVRDLAQQLLDQIVAERRARRAAGPDRPSRLAEAIGLDHVPTLTAEQEQALTAAEAAAEAAADRIYGTGAQTRNAA